MPCVDVLQSQLEYLSSIQSYSKTLQTRTYLSKKETDQALINEVHMTFSGCSSYHKDTYDFDEYIAIQCV